MSDQNLPAVGELSAASLKTNGTEIELESRGWVSTHFTDVLDVQGGTQPPKAQFVSEPTEGYVRLLQIRDFGTRPVPTYVPETSKLKKCTKDDVLIGRYGASLGRICTGMEGAYNVALAKVISTSNVNKRFIKHYLEGPAFQNPLDLLSRSAQNGFNKGDLESFDFPLPPLAEQKVIADKLDTLLAQVESTKARLQRLPDILKRFRQSVLSAAVSGKLTEEWRLNVDNKKLEIWSKAGLAKVCRSISDGDHQAPPKSDSGVPFLVISDVSRKVIDLKNATRWVPRDYYDSLKDIRKPERSDILYTVTGSFGIPVVVQTDEPFCFQRHIAIIKPDHDRVNFKYLSLFLESPEVVKHAEAIATGTAQKTVSLKNLRNFEVALPTVEEQTEIVRRVDELFQLADQIEQKANAALERVNNLTQSILAKAFRGELTAEWREQNPDLISGENSAEALLEKIKAEREKLKPKKKATRKKAKS